MNHTDYDIDQAAKRAAKLAKENYLAGKNYENPYSETDVIHFSYQSTWRLLESGKLKPENIW